MSTQKSHRHLDALQSLRGIAALIVLLRHVMICYPSEGTIRNHFIDVSLNSHAAVVIFFVLSGFVLSISIENTKIDIHSTIVFWIRRVFRILPALMFVTFLSIIFTKIPLSSLPTPGSSDFMEGLLPHNLTTSPIGVIKSFLGLASTYVPQNWTITVELIMAVLFPLLVSLTRSFSNGVYWLLFIGIIVTCTAGEGGKWLPPFYGMDFILGIAVYRFWNSSLWRPSVLATVLSVAILCGASSLVTEIVGHSLPFHYATTSIIEGFAASFVVLSLTDHDKVARYLSVRPLIVLGDLSFSLYLVHFLVVSILGRVFAPFLLNYTSFERALIMAAATLLVTLPISWFIFRGIEIPFNRLGKKLSGDFLNLIRKRSHATY
ncbi:acyltransferase [Kozakia baliensis]|uniref:acyltransferase family protein n=1 Tax=Kozakia baliensis TaxID=153496 RepID=UPI00345BDD13